MKKKALLSSIAGFTMIELMVVVAIIAILTMIGIGGYSNAMKKSRDARRKSDIQALSQALTLYRMDWAYYPSLQEYTLDEVTTTDGKHGFRPYLSQDSAYFDPSSKDFTYSGGIPTTDPGTNADRYFYSYFCMQATGGKCKAFMICAQLEAKDGGNLNPGTGSDLKKGMGGAFSASGNDLFDNKVGIVVGKTNDGSSPQWYCQQSG